MNHELVIVGGARTPMAEYSGTPGYGKLKGISAIDLAVHATKAALERAGVPAEAKAAKFLIITAVWSSEAAMGIV